MVDGTDFEVHLATCPECAGELARYREVISAVGALGDTLDPAPIDLPDRVIAHVLAAEPQWRGRARRVVHDRRVHVAAASLGGALVGAGAIAILWWRTARRPAVRAA
jgi:anti-sigma factor RsiW